MAELFDELIERRVGFCLWKSNDHLVDALAGRTDLDILVARADATRFREIVDRHGCKPLVPQPYATYPGMEHFLGFDQDDGRLFHLHVHTQLVLGERYVKNHRLPVEDRMLRSLRTLHGVPVPTADLELTILCIRTLLKYRARDVVKDILGIRTPGVPDETLREIEWLMSQTSRAALEEVTRDERVPISSSTIVTLLDTLERRRRDGRALLRLRGQVRAGLRGSQRVGRLRATSAYARTVWRRRDKLRLHPMETGMKPAGGGVAIALVGADGAGKSTAVEHLTGWLGWKLVVRTYYMGSKQPSLSSRGSYLAFRIGRRTTRSIERRRGTGTTLAQPTAALRDWLLALHHVRIGRDRLRRSKSAQRDLLAGRVVVFDRYPMARLSLGGDHHLLDGPQIPVALAGHPSRVVASLAEREQAIYRRFRLPDELIVLRVSPEVSVARKPDHDAETVRRKGVAVIELADLARAAEGAVTEIDADLPFESVIGAVKRRVWDVL